MEERTTRPVRAKEEMATVIEKKGEPRFYWVVWEGLSVRRRHGSWNLKDEKRKRKGVPDSRTNVQEIPVEGERLVPPRAKGFQQEPNHILSRNWIGVWAEPRPQRMFMALCTSWSWPLSFPTHRPRNFPVNTSGGLNWLEIIFCCLLTWPKTQARTLRRWIICTHERRESLVWKDLSLTAFLGSFLAQSPHSVYIVCFGPLLLNLHFLEEVYCLQGKPGVRRIMPFGLFHHKRMGVTNLSHTSLRACHNLLMLTLEINQTLQVHCTSLPVGQDKQFIQPFVR